VTPQLACLERLGPIINLRLFLEAVLPPNFGFSVIFDLLIMVSIQKIDLRLLILDPNWASQGSGSWHCYSFLDQAGYYATQV